ncbi:hypothetical protein FISHEDRAFT_47841 [Fistulina hepatica ATCC 64428]|uniref:Queuosine 5'-phosphate N-glycosylase/hydrolase n=1 Tax=Fistulina hepatica ATCC 64428 TaxID=1128425 RepID=A0A0D7A7W8_9AGAR|nr:hypothetical protein FISHEDRAFT_47841 [Fistulina hepatica ATCC 64428]
MPTPLPPSGLYLDSVRSSSRNLREKAGVSITPESIKRLLHSPAFILSYNRVSRLHGLKFPLNFPSALAELNFLSVLSLLNFASGYRVPLHAQTGRGAWDNMRALVFGMYISAEGDLLSARGMQSVSDTQIAELLHVDMHVERAHAAIPGLVLGELGGPMHELVTLIRCTLNETGDILVRGGYPSLGSLVVEALKSGHRLRATKGPVAELDAVLEQIVKAIPGFRDMDTVDGTPIYCFKKAMFLLCSISIRFNSSNPPFPVPDTSTLAIFSDNVLPSMLIHLGVIDVSGSAMLSDLFTEARSEDRLSRLLAATPEEPASADVQPVTSGTSKLPEEGPVISSDQAYVLRAAAIDACELIMQEAHALQVAGEESDIEWEKITPSDLDMWIWSVAKDRLDYRTLPRFVLRNTVFF